MKTSSCLSEEQALWCYFYSIKIHPLNHPAHIKQHQSFSSAKDLASLHCLMQKKVASETKSKPDVLKRANTLIRKHDAIF